jgi:hypothetical protein
VSPSGQVVADTFDKLEAGIWQGLRKPTGRLLQACVPGRDEVLRDWFQVFQMGAEAQNFAAAVWSAVRVVLTSWPRLLTSLSALA